MNQEVVDDSNAPDRRFVWIRAFILRMRGLIRSLFERIYPLGFKDEALVIVKSSIPLVILSRFL